MQKMNDPKTMAKYIGCLSILEYNTFLLYKTLSEKTQTPLAKSLLLSIAQDSSKHSTLLKGIGNSIANSEVKTKDCAENLGQIWLTVTNYLDEVKTGKVSELSLADLYEKLIPLESELGEEYYMLVQMQTLKHLTKEINERYNISFDNIKNIFENIMSDENRHIEELDTLKELSKPVEKDLDNTPLVRYQSPDNWRNYPPPFSP
ncbi:MAG TPA: ferritin-like domain-containing protein [Verrucomicrobiae bacterium]|nr:ferritin-like domain-containing protein [Verrucomicrobiae bacterium]